MRYSGASGGIACQRERCRPTDDRDPASRVHPASQPIRNQQGVGKGRMATLLLNLPFGASRSNATTPRGMLTRACSQGHAQLQPLPCLWPSATAGEEPRTELAVGLPALIEGTGKPRQDCPGAPIGPSTREGPLGVPRHHQHVGALLLCHADHFPAAACPLVDDAAQKNQPRVLFCGQPDALVAVAFFRARGAARVRWVGRRRALRATPLRLGERIGTHGGYLPFPSAGAGAGAFSIPVLAPMVSTVAGR